MSNAEWTPTPTPTAELAIGDVVSAVWGPRTGLRNPRWFTVATITPVTVSGRVFHEVTSTEGNTTLALSDTFARKVAA